MELKEYQRQEIIFREGECQKWMYSIREGSVDIVSGYGTSDEKKLVTLTKGQLFGEIGMIALLPRTATAVAAEAHVVLEQISSEDYVDYLKNHPENLLPIMSSVSRRIRELTGDLSVITQMTNEALGGRTYGNSAAVWLGKLFGKLKAMQTSGNDFIVLRKRQLALSGEIPPVIHYDTGDVIFRAGEQADCMYHIYDGTVGIYSDYRTENEKLLAQLNADAVFGEMGILDDLPRSATAVCLNGCAVMVVKPEHFMSFFQEKPAMILQILRQMCNQLHDLTEIYLQVCRTLEQLPSPEETNFREEEVLAKLEQIRQNHLSACVYDLNSSTDWVYNL